MIITINDGTKRISQEVECPLSWSVMHIRERGTGEKELGGDGQRNWREGREGIEWPPRGFLLQAWCVQAFVASLPTTNPVTLNTPSPTPAITCQRMIRNPVNLSLKARPIWIPQSNRSSYFQGRPSQPHIHHLSNIPSIPSMTLDLRPKTSVYRYMSISKISSPSYIPFLQVEKIYQETSTKNYLNIYPAQTSSIPPI